MSAVTGTFAAVGSSSALLPVPQEGGDQKNMNLSLSGTWAGTILLERSFDGGTNYFTVNSYTANTEARIPESEVGVLYRLTCSVYTSGTVTYRLSI